MSKHEYPGFTYLPKHRHEPQERKVVEMSPGVYAFIGYSTSNFGVIAGKSGYILIDTGDNITGAKEALELIKNLVPLSLKAVILTHGHPDHRSGAQAFLEGQPENISVWGHHNFGAEGKAGAGLEKVCVFRAQKQFGVGIPDELYTVNSILPRIPGAQPGPMLAPNNFVPEGKTELSIDGVRLELHTLPGESYDHLAVWLPEQRALFSGDQIYYSFPNIYPVRGGAYRDVELWAKAVRRLIEFKPRAIMFGHSDALVGEAAITTLLTEYAEAIEYVYDETVKGMNAGKTPDELAATVQLPPDLRGRHFLGEFYGAVPWAVRSIYAARLGWFDGNPSKLVPLAPPEEAERMARLAGGAEQLAKAAQKALTGEDYRWAAQLADHLLLLGQEQEGKRIKADALEALSRIILPMTGKNYLLRSALDLRKG